MREKSPFGKRSPYGNSGPDGGPKPIYTGPPVLTSTGTLVGDDLTVTFTVTGVGTLTVTVQFLNGEDVVDTQTPTVVSGVEEVVTFESLDAGIHTARVTTTDDNGTRPAASNTITITNTEGAFSSSFDASFAIIS